MSLLSDMVNETGVVLGRDSRAVVSELAPHRLVVTGSNPDGDFFRSSSKEQCFKYNKPHILTKARYTA